LTLDSQEPSQQTALRLNNHGQVTTGTAEEPVFVGWGIVRGELGGAVFGFPSLSFGDGL
jgi:hypothetical protein